MEERLSPFFEQLDSVYRQGFPEAVEAFLQESLCRAEGETDQELELAVWNELGSFFRGTGRYEESLSAFRRAEDLARKLRGRDSGGYATVLNNMAGTCRLLHKASEAESLFLRAIECYRQAGLEDSDAYTSVLNNLSLVYRETGDLEKAIDYLLRALKRLEGRGDRRAELAVTYNNLTTLYQAAGDRDKALLCVNRALQEYEKCPEEPASHGCWQEGRGGESPGAWTLAGELCTGGDGSMGRGACMSRGGWGVHLSAVLKQPFLANAGLICAKETRGECKIYNKRNTARRALALICCYRSQLDPVIYPAAVLLIFRWRREVKSSPQRE